VRLVVIARRGVNVKLHTSKFVLVVNLLADRAVTEATVTKRYPIRTILFIETCDKMDFPIETAFHGTETIGRPLQA
jgi:hypothetical protein